MRSPMPSSPNECIYTIRAQNLRICQLRLDFSFAIDSPNLVDDAMVCNTGRLKVSYESFEFEMCGANYDQHSKS